MRPSAPACERNRGPILTVLQQELSGAQKLLEIGSGTGEHAVFCAARMPGVTWQTSDVVANHEGIQQWLDWANLDNVLPPLSCDTRVPPDLQRASYSAVFSANTSHIMDRDAVRGMFAIAGDVLEANGVFILYGPFRQGGQFTGPTDESFDADLQSRDSAMGIRDLEWLEELAAASQMQRKALYAMPANNWIVVWQKAVAQ